MCGFLEGSRTRTARWALALLLNTPTSAASRNGRPRRIRNGTTPSLARIGRSLHQTNVSISSSKKLPGGRGGYNRWTINGRSWPDTNPLFTTEVGKRYRLAMTNKSGDNHPVHLHRHTFEVTKVGDKATAGVMKDTINMTRFSTVEIDFVADDPGPTLLHCHHQDHQDEGFMGLVTYL